MSLRQPQLDDIQMPPEPGYTQGGLRVEDVLRNLVIIIGILVGGAVLGNWTFSEIQGRGTPYFVLALSLGIVVTALAYYKFEIVLLGYIAAIWINFGGTPDLANGVSSGTGKSIYPVELATIFLLFVWFLRDVTQGRLHWARTPMNRPLVLYFLFCVWATFSGWLFFDPQIRQIYHGQQTPVLVYGVELLLRLLSIAAFWLLASNLNDMKWLRRASWFLLAPGALILLGYLHLFPSLQASNWGMLMETVLACTLFAWLLEGREAARFEGRPERSRLLRLLAWLALGFIVYHVFLGNIAWISGWISLFAGLLFVAFLRSKKLFAALACLGVILILACQPFLQTHVVGKVMNSGDKDRFAMARAAFNYATMNFGLGIGPGNFRLYNAYYGQAPGLTNGKTWGTTTYTSAHGFYTQTLSETGFIGMVLTIVWVVTGLIMLARFYHRLPPGFSRIMTLGIAGMWGGIAAATSFGDYFIPVYHNGGLVTMSVTIYVWMGLGIATAHARLNGILNDDGKMPAPPPRLQPTRISAVDYYPRRMAR